MKSAARRADGSAYSAGVPRQLMTAAGNIGSFTLPDGTRLVLGPRSLLTIDEGFGAANRVVSLRGDAYFDVVHEPARPFTVRTPYVELVDVGTAFSVRDAGALGVHVSVASGRVTARAAGGASAETVTLGPRDRATVQPDGRIRVEIGAGTADDHTWTQGRLVFRDAPLDYVAAELRRWYGIDLRVGDPVFRTRRLTATFDRASASDVGPVIAAALGGTARQTGETLYVTPIPGGARRR
ncbi:MAG TPA: FecR domain-containing protein [Gemmatimonadaceae bacterium]